MDVTKIGRISLQINNIIIRNMDIRNPDLYNIDIHNSDIRNLDMRNLDTYNTDNEMKQRNSIVLIWITKIKNLKIYRIYVHLLIP
jgi:uncharacterized protein YjbI with pentapeptide repeats